MAFRRGQGRGRGPDRSRSRNQGSAVRRDVRERNARGHRKEATPSSARRHGEQSDGARRATYVLGRFTVQRSGVGFVIPASGQGGDIFVHPSNFGEAWHGDQVKVALLPRRGRSREGAVVEVVSRGRATIVAEVMRSYGKKGWLCRPVDERMHIALLAAVPESTSDMAKNQPRRGDMVLLKPGEPLERGLWEADILANYGSGDDLTTQERIVKAGHGIPMEFPATVLEAALAVQEHGQSELAGLAELLGSGERRDLRHIAFVTIDGENARDFDDAIYVQERGSGYSLWVAIADVSHYVKPLSPLDREAFNRGNSYYFPQSVEPMLPEALSNDLCSLRPDAPRLAVAARMDFNAEGRPESHGEFYAAVIQSHARLTYTQVFQEVIEREQRDQGKLSDNLAPHWEMLKTAEKLARLMHARRQEAGGLDFELPEPEIRVNAAGETALLAREEHNFSHQLIEMFMVAANEATALFLTRRHQPLPYRIHPSPDPDKLWGLFEMLKRTGLTELPKQPGPGSLPGILAAAAGTDAEFVVSRLVLRSMMQAKYSLDNEGHFGLASDCYCHFTSPIRRYADLLTHRALKHALGLSGYGPLPDKPRLAEMLDAVNSNEQTAKAAEREILKRMTVILLQDQVGQIFNGVISGVTDFGLFVELTETMAEGMIKLESLPADYYDYFPERQELLGRGTRQRFHLGRAVRVRLVEANVRLLEINLELIQERKSPRKR